MAIQNSARDLLSWITLKRLRFFELAVGITANNLIDFLFDLILYPFVIYNFGLLKGGVVMTFLSFLACLATMRFYDWSKRDWLGIEAIKSLKEYGGDKQLGRFTAWVLAQSDPVVFLYLSVQRDPFITTAYLRQGAFNGMNRRDWSVFMSSLFIGNAYWALAVYMGISLVEWVWKVFAA